MEVKEFFGNIFKKLGPTEFDEFDHYQKRKQQFDEAIQQGSTPKETLEAFAGKNSESPPVNSQTPEYLPK